MSLGRLGLSIFHATSVICEIPSGCWRDRRQDQSVSEPRIAGLCLLFLMLVGQGNFGFMGKRLWWLVLGPIYFDSGTSAAMLMRFICGGWLKERYFHSSPLYVWGGWSDPNGLGWICPDTRPTISSEFPSFFSDLMLKEPASRQRKQNAWLWKRLSGQSKRSCRNAYLDDAKSSTRMFYFYYQNQLPDLRLGSW